MVMVTIDIPQDINKEIEHFKVEHELKDKREAINLLLKQCVLNVGNQKKFKSQRINPYETLFKLADTTKRHDVTPKQIKAMDNDIYD
jgi:hypothetical protein